MDFDVQFPCLGDPPSSPHAEAGGYTTGPKALETSTGRVARIVGCKMVGVLKAQIGILLRDFERDEITIY